MAIVFNTKGVVANEKSFIEKEGTYLFKIVKVVEDGSYSNGGNPYVKMDFECKQIVTGSNGKAKLDEDNLYMFSEKFCTDENQLFKVARLRDALKAPEVFTLESTVGYSVIGSITKREYNNKNYAQIKKLGYSKANDNLPPIPEAKEQQNNTQDVPETPVVEVDVNQDEIPF